MSNTVKARPSLTTSKIVFLVVAAAHRWLRWSVSSHCSSRWQRRRDTGRIPAGRRRAALFRRRLRIDEPADHEHRRLLHVHRARIGRPPAVAGAIIAVIAYNAVTVQLVGGFGYFARLVIQQQASVTLPGSCTRGSPLW